MVTDRLYLADSLLLRFDARVVGKSRFAGAPSLVLDRSAFYPEGGGQLGDRGVLRTAALPPIDVIDVQIDDEQAVHHLLAAEAPDEIVGVEVRGEIDEARRRDHMSQHTGQHMLSSALLEKAGAATVSSRLGSELCTIDLDLATVDDAALERAEDAVNEAVLRDSPVVTHYPTPEELEKLPLRRRPKVERDIRIIEVSGFDFSPCGGTHCQRTGQVGPVRILKTERYKGGTRVTFVAGRRTIRDHRERDAVLRDLGRALKCGALDVPGAVAKLRSELKSAQEALGLARAELMQSASEKLLAEHPARPGETTTILALRDAGDVESLRALAGALAHRPDVAAIAAARDPGGEWLVVVEKGAEAAFHAGNWLRGETGRWGGRGGGRAEHAEGRLPSTADWEAIRASLGTAVQNR